MCGVAQCEDGGVATAVFISYRRADSIHLAGRFRDRLAQTLGETNVFLDLTSIPLATDFRETVRAALRRVDAVIVLIGPRFDPRRLHEPNDVVRMELLEALERGKPLLPILVGDARMPTTDELPDELGSLSFLNATTLRPDPDFGTDAQRVLRTLFRLTARPRLLKPSDRGPQVVRLQELFAASGRNPGPVDGIFGPATRRAVEKLQGQSSLVQDGVVGPDTWSALLAAQPLVRLGSRGRSVLELQQLLVASGFDSGPVDGIFGPLTDTAVRSLQASHRLGIDGICGRHTWATLVHLVLG
jgi:peptidoglycan hydrolase-like protein with peptidoglycan-binding domain